MTVANAREQLIGGAASNRLDQPWLASRTGIAKRLLSFGGSPWFCATLALVLIVWMAVVAGRSAVLVLQSFGLPLMGGSTPSFATPQLLGAAGLIVLVCVVSGLIALPSGDLISIRTGHNARPCVRVHATH